MKELVKKNWFFLILLLVLGIVFMKRNLNLDMPVVSIPDAQVGFSTQDSVMEQTWQPVIKKIAGIQLPYYAENNFSCDVQLKIFTDDYSQIIVEDAVKNINFEANQRGEVSFSFHKVPVTPGERYHIQFLLKNVTAQGTLQIPSGSNYGGCSIGGENLGQAAAITIISLKYSKLFWLVAVLFPLLTFSLLAMVVTGRKWEETVALSLFIEGILLYIFGLLEHLTWGIGVVYALAVFSLLLAIYIFNRKALYLKDLLSPGLWIYLVLFGVILITCRGDWIAIRDELRHWEIAVRDMFYYDSFAKHMNTTVILPRYLPFAALIEYVFEFMNGMFSEDILFIAYQTMLLSVSVIMCKSLHKKGGLKLLVPTIVAIVCIPALFFNNISSCIMVDSLISAVFAYILVCYFTDEASLFNYIRIGSALVVLVLAKDIGLIYSAMVAFIIFGDVLFTQIRMRQFRIKSFLVPIAGGLLAIVVFFSWQIYLSIPVEETIAKKTEAYVSEASEGTEGKNVEETNSSVDTAISASGITLSGILDVLSGEGEEYQYQVTYNFVKELFEGETYSLSTVSVSFVDLLAVVVALIFLFGYFGYWQEDKNRMYGMAVLFLLASVFLCAFLLVTYWFTFSMYEALELTSVDRYLAPYICAVMILTFYIIYDRLQYLPRAARKERCLVSVLAFVIVISMPVADLIWESKDKTPNATENIVYGHSDLAEILRSIAKRGERAYFVCSNSGGLSEYIFRNTVCPIISIHENWNIVSTQEAAEQVRKEYGGDGFGVQVLPVEDWKESLKKCQYVVVFHADDLFKQSYGELFEPSEIEDGSVYLVLNKQGTVELQLIGKTGVKEWY